MELVNEPNTCKWEGSRTHRVFLIVDRSNRTSPKPNLISLMKRGCKKRGLRHAHTSLAHTITLETGPNLIDTIELYSFMILSEHQISLTKFQHIQPKIHHLPIKTSPNLRNLKKKKRILKEKWKISNRFSIIIKQARPFIIWLKENY